MRSSAEHKMAPLYFFRNIDIKFRVLFLRVIHPVKYNGGRTRKFLPRSRKGTNLVGCRTTNFNFTI